MDETGDDFGSDIEFNETGNAMFVLISNDTLDGLNYLQNYIYQFKLEKNFDVSTATLMLENIKMPILVMRIHLERGFRDAKRIYFFDGMRILL